MATRTCLICRRTKTETLFARRHVPSEGRSGYRNHCLECYGAARKRAPPPLGEAAIQALARNVARSYARRAPWVALDDLVQEAHVAMLEAQRRGRFDPARGKEAAYLCVAASRAVGNFVRDHAPVKLPTRHFVAELTGIRRASREKFERWAERAGSDPREQLTSSLWGDKARARLYELAGQLRLGGAGLRVLYGEKPAQVAESLGRRRQEVYNATGKLRALAMADARMLELWQELA